MKSLAIFQCFLLTVTWLFDFFRIFKKHLKLDAGRHVCADFHLNRSGDSLEIRAREKRKNNKSTEKHNITFASQNGNIIELWPGKLGIQEYIFPKVIKIFPKAQPEGIS